MDRIVPYGAQADLAEKTKQKKEGKKKLRNAWLTSAHSRAGEARTGHIGGRGESG